MSGMKELRVKVNVLETKVKDVVGRFDTASDEELFAISEEIDGMIDGVFTFEFEGDELIEELKAFRDTLTSFINIMETIETSVS